MREGYKPAEWSIGTPELLAARRRWMRAGFSALLRCAETDGIGMRRFLEVADATQRDLVAKTAIEFYKEELGLEDDTFEVFFGVTSIGVVGAGFDYEVEKYTTENSAAAEQYRCPLIGHANSAGYDIGHPALKDMSLWCDTYDNFESAAVAPSMTMVHSHCLGLGDPQCRWYIESVAPERRRGPEEHVHDYMSRMRKAFRDRGDGPWVIDDKTPSEIEQLTVDNVSVAEKMQSDIWPTDHDKLEQGVLISSRIGACSVLIGGELLGWDNYIEGMEDKEGPILQQVAGETAQERGIYGETAVAGAALHEALSLGTLAGPFELDIESVNKVVGTCTRCPLVEAGQESGLGDACTRVMPHCSASRTYEVQALGERLTHSYTHCLGRGDDVCRWVIEKDESRPATVAAIGGSE